MSIIQWDRESIRRILVIKMRYIGDTILATPVLRALKTALPNIRIDLLINKETAAVVHGHPDIDQLLAYDYHRAKRDPLYFIKFLFQIGRLHWDVALDLTGNDRSALFTFVSGATNRWGYESGKTLKKRAYTHRLPNRFGRMHTVDHHLEMVRALGIPADDPHPYLIVSDQDRQWIRGLLESHQMRPDRPMVVIHPGARRWYKSWPTERFSRTIGRLTRRYPVQVVLSGGAEDTEKCGRIADQAQCPLVDLSGKVPLGRLPALIQAGVMMIGNDSAPIHVATAVNTPVIALFGPTRWEDWQPRRAHDTTLGIVFPCRPCGHARPDCPLGDGYCMSEITEEMVWKAIETRLHTMGIEKIK